ncbi:MAG: hypothetical protein GY951_10470 [Psychromonas sp.]|nr:hypothetical protein [Psychromonas sp.]
MIKLIKKTSGLVQIVDGSDTLSTLQGVATLQAFDEFVQVTDVNGRVQDLYTRAIGQTQIEPNAPVDFAGDTQDLIELLDNSFFGDTPASGGGGGGSIETGATPPTDTTKLWANDSDNIIYRYNSDISKWVSTSTERIMYSLNGLIGNGVFINFGRATTSGLQGAPLGSSYLFTGFSYKSVAALLDQQYAFYDKTGILVSQAIPGQNSGLQLFASPFTLDSDNFLSCQHFGSTSSNVAVNVILYKIYE